MNRTTQDWAQWDDAYAFVSGNNPNFVKKDLPPNTFSRIDVNLIIIVNNNGKIMYGKAYNLKQTNITSLPKNLTSLQRIVHY